MKISNSELFSEIDKHKFADPDEGHTVNERKRSRIDKYFSQDIRGLILKCINEECDNNHTADIIKDALSPLGFTEIGTGTNRIVFIKDGYAFKIAMDRRGCIDNMSEYMRSIEEPRKLAKVYETNRMIAVVEYALLISVEEFERNIDTIRKMLMDLSTRYVMQDLGTTRKNYCNIGIRESTGEFIFIDYAYMYKIAGNEQALICPMCGSTIIPDKNFTGYACSNSKCAMTFLTLEILNQMDRDVDAIDDEEVIEMIGTDDQGSDSSNFAFIHIKGEDIGEAELVSKDEADRIRERVAKFSENEDKFLNTPKSISDITVEEFVDEEEPQLPEIRYLSEGIETLTVDEYAKLYNLNEAVKEE